MPTAAEKRGQGTKKAPKKPVRKKAVSTEIIFVLDRSGSMNKVASDVRGGFNDFLSEQAKQVGKATVSLHQFDHLYETVYEGKPLEDAPRLDGSNYRPRGMTALLDAVGKTINGTQVRLDALPKKSKPGQVLFVIYTDGFENQSQEFDRATVHKLIEECRNERKWEFVFLGADQDAFHEGGQVLGQAFKADTHSMSVAGTPEGTRAAFMSLNTATERYRSRAGKLSSGYFTEEERGTPMDRQTRRSTKEPAKPSASPAPRAKRPSVWD